MSKFLVALACVLPAVLVGCGGGSSSAPLLTSPSDPVTNPAGSSSSSTTPTSQTITFSVAALAVGSTVQLQGSASSGLPVIYASQTPTTCSVSGSNVTALALGSCTLTANQAGNASFSAASQVQVVVPVLKAQSITGFTVPSLSSGTIAVLNPIATSGLPVYILSLTQGVCTVNQNIAIYAGTTGTCTLQAFQAGNGQYAASPALTVSTTVTASNTSLTTNAVLAPWITAGAQAGSTAADSTTSVEGIYNNKAYAFALIDGANNFSFYDFYGFLFGSFTPNSTSQTWVLNSSPTYYPTIYNPSTTSSTTITANGTFVPKQTFAAAVQSFATFPTFEADGTTSSSLLYLTYSKDNGYAASQSSVAGNWLYNDGTNQFNLKVDNAGVITGTEVDTVGGVCNLSGSIVQAESGSQHNMYSVSLSAADGVGVDGSKAFCNLNKANPYKGLAALQFLKAGTNDSNGYLPSLVLLTQDAATSHTLKLTFLNP
ncbi:MAG: hypothetical protein KGO49_09225 [Gammaproteobacteria bacterium]|nr:hypothetical protein [Gammaproteobacteria bacterium]